MTSFVEQVAADLWEISSEQRLKIILKLDKKKYTISSLAKEIEATIPEVHRNFIRLTKAGLISKNTEGSYSLTEYGNVICQQIPTFVFMSNHKKYFKKHSVEDIPIKFIHRIGELSNSKLITGHIKTQEKWEEIYRNSKKYIYNILFEASYNENTLNVIQDKLQTTVTINSIFSESAMVSKDRKSKIKNIDISKFLNENTLKRKMNKTIKISLVLNEQEAGICFPEHNEEFPDLSKIIYSDDDDFHDWCYDYFLYVWNNSNSFQESKLKE